MSKDYVSDFVYISQQEAEFVRGTISRLESLRGSTTDPDVVSSLNEIYHNVQKFVTFANLKAASGITQVTLSTPACPTIETEDDLLDLEVPAQEPEE